GRASPRARGSGSCASRRSCATTACTRPSARAGARTSRPPAGSSPRRAPRPDVPGIGVIINPHARANRNGGAERVRRLAEIVGGDGAVRVTESLPAIQDVAREFRARGTEVLAICGGDGSYHCTLTGFRAVYGDAPLPLLLPLRAGTINYVSDAIGGRRRGPEQVLARRGRAHRRGRLYGPTGADLPRPDGGG